VKRALVLVLLVAACDDKPAPSAASASAKPPPPPPPPAATSAAPVASGPSAPPSEIAAQHVLVVWKGAKNAPKDVKRTKAEAKKRAEEAVAKARTAGVDFADVVKEFSDDAATKDRLGNLGKFPRDKMVKPFSDAAFALPVGGVSEPVESDFGFHVIKRNQ